MRSPNWLAPLRQAASREPTAPESYCRTVLPEEMRNGKTAETHRAVRRPYPRARSVPAAVAAYRRLPCGAHSAESDYSPPRRLRARRSRTRGAGAIGDPSLVTSFRRGRTDDHDAIRHLRVTERSRSARLFACAPRSEGDRRGETCLNGSYAFARSPHGRPRTTSTTNTSRAPPTSPVTSQQPSPENEIAVG